MRLRHCVFALLALAACATPRLVAFRHDSPQALLATILDLARKGDYEAIGLLIYPVGIGNGLTNRDAILHYMRKPSDAVGIGDFAYSEEALSMIVDASLEFAPVGTHWDDLVASGLVDDRLLNLTDGNPERFMEASHHHCHIVVVELDGNYYLLFWEGMLNAFSRQ